MTKLPLFPDFERLDLSHKDLLRETARRFPPYSDYNFVSLFTWDTAEVIGVAELCGNLVVRFSDYSNGEVFISLLGTHELPKTLEILFEYCRNQHIVQKLQLIPNSVIKALPNELHQIYNVEEDRDNHDYIVSVGQVCRGEISRNKRRSYNRFLSMYGDRVHCKTIDLNMDSGRNQIREVVKSWTRTMAVSSENESEFIAIERCLKHSRELDVEAYGAFVDDKIVAFIIYELGHGSTAMLHYGKSDHGLPGGFDYMKIELAKYLEDRGVEFMNFEQDLGIEGLRADKSAFRPVEFLRKYTISLR